MPQSSTSEAGLSARMTHSWAILFCVALQGEADPLSPKGGAAASIFPYRVNQVEHRSKIDAIVSPQQRFNLLLFSRRDTLSARIQRSRVLKP